MFVTGGTVMVVVELVRDASVVSSGVVAVD